MNAITDKQLGEVQEAYLNDTGNGDILNKFKKEFKNSKSLKYIIDNAIRLEDKIYTKSNVIQKVILTRIFISTLLVLRSKKDIDIIDALTLCDILSSDDLWLLSVKKIILPILDKEL